MKWCKIEFSHLDDDRLWDLLSAHGMAGHGFYMWLYTELYQLENQGFQIDYTPRWLKRTAHDLFCEPEQIEVLLNYLSELNLINRQLWSDSIIFIDEIAQHADTYMKKKIQDRDRKRRQRQNQSSSDSSRGTTMDGHGAHQILPGTHKVPPSTPSAPEPTFLDLEVAPDQRPRIEQQPAQNQGQDHNFNHPQRKNKGFSDLSRVTNAMSQNVTPPDSDPDSDPDPNSKTKIKKEIKKKMIAVSQPDHQEHPLPRSGDQGEMIPIMKVVEKSAPVIAAKARQHNESRRKIAYPETFEIWWRSYYKFCLVVKASAGSKVQAFDEWKQLIQELDDPEVIVEGTKIYIATQTESYRQRGQVVGVPHGVRYLKNHYFQEALDRVEVQQSNVIDQISPPERPAITRIAYDPLSNQPVVINL